MNTLFFILAINAIRLYSAGIGFLKSTL